MAGSVDTDETNTEQLGSGDPSVGGAGSELLTHDYDHERPDPDQAINDNHPTDINSANIEIMTKAIAESVLNQVQSSIMNEVRKAFQQFASYSDKTTSAIQSASIQSAPTRPFRSTLKFSNITQNSILTESVDYILWKEKLITELRSRGCLHFVDVTAEKPEGINEEEMEADRAAVESAIRERLDEKHLRIIKGKHTPLEIIKALDSFRDPVGELAAVPIWENFQALTYEIGKETAHDFVYRFDQLVDELRRKNEEPDDATMKRQWLKATRGKCPNLMTREQTCIQMHGKGLTAEQFRAAFLSTESCNEALGLVGVGDEKEKAFKLKSEERIKHPKNDLLHWHRDARITYKGKVVKCTNCGAFGHFKSECKSNKILCYECGRMGDHIAAECPKNNRPSHSTRRAPKRKHEDDYRRSEYDRKKGESEYDKSYDKSNQNRKSTKKLVSFKKAKKSKKNYANLAKDMRLIDGQFYFVMGDDDGSSSESSESSNKSARVNFARQKDDTPDGSGFKLNSSWN